MGGGTRPFLTTQVKVKQLGPKRMTVEFKDSDDSSYFVEGNEYVAVFLPAPAANPGSATAKPTDS